MLNLLKRDLVERGQRTTVAELMVESVSNDDIRDAFLDNPKYIFLGSENDPVVEREIDGIPEYEDGLSDEELDELESITESVDLIPEQEI